MACLRSSWGTWALAVTGNRTRDWPLTPFLFHSKPSPFSVAAVADFGAAEAMLPHFLPFTSCSVIVWNTNLLLPILLVDQPPEDLVPKEKPTKPDTRWQDIAARIMIRLTSITVVSNINCVISALLLRPGKYGQDPRGTLESLVNWRYLVRPGAASIYPCKASTPSPTS